MNRSYFFFGDYLRSKYHCRVLKLSLNTNLSCPNRDGSLGFSGCIFCSENGSASPVSSVSDDLVKQMEDGRNNFKRSDEDTRYIAYLQAFTNTFGTPEKLKKIYDAAVSSPDVIGLMIGTRPDCLSDEILELISSYKKDNFELWLEIGMQSIHDKSLQFLRRMHDSDISVKSILSASSRGIPVCVHIILGIPGESWSDMMRTAEVISSLPVNGVKIHQLHVIRRTLLEQLYADNKINILSMKEYVSIICDFIERLRPDITIHRLIADRDEKSLVAPRWGMHKGTVIKAIEDEFIRRGSYQGILVKSGF